jgi:hypothetical protein
MASHKRNKKCFTISAIQFQPPAQHNAQYCSQMAATLPCIDRANLGPEAVYYDSLFMLSVPPDICRQYLELDNDNFLTHTFQFVFSLTNIPFNEWGNESN